MKKIRLVSNFLFICIGLLALSSCNSDPEPNVPYDAQDVYGEYDGTLTTNNVAPRNTKVAITDIAITMSKFPFHELVRAALPADKAEEAIKSMEKEIEFNFPYKAAKLSTGMISVSPIFYGSLAIPVIVDGQQQYVLATFDVPGDGVIPSGMYDPTSKTLRLEIKVTTLIYKNVKVEGFAGNTYRFVSTAKTQS